MGAFVSRQPIIFYVAHHWARAASQPPRDKRGNEIREVLAEEGQGKGTEMRMQELQERRTSDLEEGRVGGGRAKQKKRMTGYHFISSAVELRLINALLSVCCDPARAAHERDEGKARPMVRLRSREREGSACSAA